MNRIGQESNPKSAMNPVSSPRVTAPVLTRVAPTARSTAVASVGRESSAASKVARM